MIGLLSACEQPVEGCLDTTATNYDVAVDEPCPNCCEYPALKLKFEHRIGLAQFPDSTTTIRYNTDYYTSANLTEPFQFTKIKFYVSQVELIADGQAYQVSSTIKLPQIDGSDSLEVIDDFVLIDRSNTSSVLSLGSFTQEATFDSIRFLVGLAEPIRTTDAAGMEDGHALAIQTDSLNYELPFGYIDNRLAFIQDTMTKVIDTLNIQENVAIDVQLSQPFTLFKGFNSVINVQIDYLKWVDELDMTMATDEQIKAAILQNVASSITEVTIVQE